MSTTLHRASRVLAASILLFLCVFLSGCQDDVTPSPADTPDTPSSDSTAEPAPAKTVSVHLSNQSGRDVTAYITSMGGSSLPLSGYPLASGVDFQVSIPASALHSPLYIYLLDSTGTRSFYSDIEVPELGDAIALTLRMEDTRLVLDVDWGNGTSRTLYPAASLSEIYYGSYIWMNLGVLPYEEYILDDFWLKVPGYNEAKWARIYGSVDSDGYSSKEEVLSHIVRVTFPIWKLSNGKKVSSKATLQVHAAVADEVVQIFTEIYNDPEQFPIKSVGGYSWRGDNSSSLHNIGLAIDINPNENYQIRYGNVVVGSFWDPSSSPYSIPEDSSVVRIFEAHGWSWGGDAWAGFTTPSTEGNHDYMHFSYFGT